jgi:hypothetical protein
MNVAIYLVSSFTEAAKLLQVTMSDTNLRPGVFDDTMPRRGIVKSNDLPHLEVVISDTTGVH